MVELVFETHATTVDNENGIASGHHDAELSELGLRQARELGARYADDHFHVVFCSDLQRSYVTAELAFGSRFPIVRDARLRECDYGDLTRRQRREVDAERPHRITEPFPNGESYQQTAERMRRFLADLLRRHDGARVMIVGHRATHDALEHWIAGVPLRTAVTSRWTWQPGWTYQLVQTPESAAGA